MLYMSYVAWKWLPLDFCAKLITVVDLGWFGVSMVRLTENGSQFLCPPPQNFPEVVLYFEVLCYYWSNIQDELCYPVRIRLPRK